MIIVDARDFTLNSTNPPSSCSATSLAPPLPAEKDFPVTVFLSALPVLSTILALGFGAHSLHAALLGVGAAVMAILLAFPIPMDSIAPAALSWTPILTEVLLIV